MATFRDMIDAARGELGDTYVGSYSYESDDMLRYAIQGVREAWRARPSLKYDTATGRLYDESIVFPTSYDTGGVEIPLPESHMEAILWFIIYRCASRDLTDTGNANIAASAKDKFDKIVAG